MNTNYYGYSTSRFCVGNYTTWTSNDSDDYIVYATLDYDPYSYKPRYKLTKIKKEKSYHLEDELFEI